MFDTLSLTLYDSMTLVSSDASSPEKGQLGVQFNARGRTLLIFSSQGQEVDVHKVGKGRQVGRR